MRMTEFIIILTTVFVVVEVLPSFFKGGGGINCTTLPDIDVLVQGGTATLLTILATHIGWMKNCSCPCVHRLCQTLDTSYYCTLCRNM